MVANYEGAGQRELARGRWRAEIRELAAGMPLAESADVPLAHAAALLSVERIIDAIEKACRDFANANSDGVLPRAADTPPPAIRYAVIYSRDDLDRHLHGYVLLALREGRFRASGYDSRAPINALRIRIPPQRWAGLIPDFDKSEAVAEGFKLTDILVTELENHHDTLDVFPARRRGPKTATRDRVERAMRADIASGKFSLADLQGMKGEALAAAYGTGRFTARVALSLIQLATNSDNEKIARRGNCRQTPPRY